MFYATDMKSLNMVAQLKHRIPFATGKQHRNWESPTYVVGGFVRDRLMQRPLRILI